MTKEWLQHYRVCIIWEMCVGDVRAGVGGARVYFLLL